MSAEPHGSIYTGNNWLWVERIGSFGSFPPYARIVAQTDPKVHGLLFRPDDPDVSAARLTECRLKGLKAGVAYGTAFPADPVKAAEAVSASISALDPDYVFLDQEMHSYDWIFRFFLGDKLGGVVRKGYRGSGGEENGKGLRPGKASDFSNEPNQDGAWGDPRGSIYPLLIRLRLGLIRQPYLGDMTPVDFDVTRDWILQSVPDSFRLVRACYDPRPGLPKGILGGACIFYAERWPAMWSGVERALRKDVRATAEVQKTLSAHRAIAKIIGQERGGTWVSAHAVETSVNTEVWNRAAWWENAAA